MDDFPIPVHGVLYVEGKETEDQRAIEPRAVTFNRLPAPISIEGGEIVGAVLSVATDSDGTVRYEGCVTDAQLADALRPAIELDLVDYHEHEQVLVVTGGRLRGVRLCDDPAPTEASIFITDTEGTNNG